MIPAGFVELTLEEAQLIRGFFNKRAVGIDSLRCKRLAKGLDVTILDGVRAAYQGQVSKMDSFIASLKEPGPPIVSQRGVDERLEVWALLDKIVGNKKAQNERKTDE